MNVDDLCVIDNLAAHNGQYRLCLWQILWRNGVLVPPRAVFNYLDTMIAMVEVGEGVAVIPSFVLPACRNRKVVMSRLINPVVHVDFSRISLRGKRLPTGADDFTSFLQGYIARWAGRAGIL